MAYEQQEGRGFTARQKCDSISRYELFQRQEGKKRIYMTANSTQDAYYGWKSALSFSQSSATFY